LFACLLVCVSCLFWRRSQILILLVLIFSFSVRRNAIFFARVLPQGKERVHSYLAHVCIIRYCVSCIRNCWHTFEACGGGTYASIRAMRMMLAHPCLLLPTLLRGTSDTYLFRFRTWQCRVTDSVSLSCATDVVS
jgi:hypothetical protein